eukprot:9243870-Pyramimonas_sp.AAC.1
MTPPMQLASVLLLAWWIGAVSGVGVIRLRTATVRVTNEASAKPPPRRLNDASAGSSSGVSGPSRGRSLFEEGGPQHYLVAVRGSLEAHLLRKLQERVVDSGGALLGYVPEDAYLVQGDDHTVDALYGLEEV